MKDFDLLRAMSDIDEKYILEAAPDQMSPKTVPFWRRRGFRSIAALAAACFVCVLGLHIYQTRHWNDPMRIESVPDENTMEEPRQEGTKAQDASQQAAEPDAAAQADAEYEPGAAYEADALYGSAGDEPDRVSGLTGRLEQTETESEAVTEDETESETESETGSEAKTG